MTNLIGKLVVGVLGVGMLVSGLLIDVPKPNTQTIPNEQIIQKDTLDTWLDKLETYENCPVEGMIDTNHKKSYGCLCFQENTFRVYTKLYNFLPEAEDQELMNMIGDCPFQKSLAKKMIQDNYLNYPHWITSVKRGANLPPK